jgi:hypothetical protein
VQLVNRLALKIRQVTTKQISPKLHMLVAVLENPGAGMHAVVGGSACVAPRVSPSGVG